MSTPSVVPVYQGPAIAESVPFEIRLHLQQIYQKLGNHVQGFSLLNDKVQKITAGATTINESLTVAGGGGGTVVSSVGLVNNQTGVTSYGTTSGDNGSIIILNDASPISVGLNGSTPSYFIWFINYGAGLVTFTPFSGTISYGATTGAGTMTLEQGRTCLIAWDGANWWADQEVIPETFTAVTHEWIDSYDATTGQFTATRPDYSDLTGTPQLPNTIAPVAGEYLTGYDATTGNFSQSTPAGISVTITTAQLTPTGTQGSMTFVGGILTAQTPAT